MRVAALLIILSLITVVGCSQPKTSAPETPQALVKHGATVVDVRTVREDQANHVQGTTNVPLDELEQRISAVVTDKSAPVLVHCQSGGRNAAAAKTLQSMGYKQVVDLGSLANARKVVESQ